MSSVQNLVYFLIFVSISCAQDQKQSPNQINVGSRSQVWLHNFPNSAILATDGGDPSLTEKFLEGTEGESDEDEEPSAAVAVSSDSTGSDEPSERERVRGLAKERCETRIGQMIQHPNDTCSSRFFLCSRKDGPIERNCEFPASEAYSNLVRKCVPRAVLPACKDTPSPVDCSKEDEGNHPVLVYERGCSPFFVTCVHNVGLKRRCASPMTRYDSTTDRCLFAEYVEICGGRPTPLPGQITTPRPSATTPAAKPTTTSRPSTVETKTTRPRPTTVEVSTSPETAENVTLPASQTTPEITNITETTPGTTEQTEGGQETGSPAGNENPGNGDGDTIVDRMIELVERVKRLAAGSPRRSAAERQRRSS